jgi:hypothetical protein
MIIVIERKFKQERARKQEKEISRRIRKRKRIKES